ncbi:MAG: helix-turn-helix transcriptional regulator [Flavobacteriaceae bacterium]|nr:helix-turn-helix transcriptional regulator [Flavobacteriaceae bacterium]
MLIIVCCSNFISVVNLHTLISNDLKEDILLKFGKKVKEARKVKGISQEELAFQAGLHRTYIGMIERAEKNITLLNIEKIANALNVNINYFFDENKRNNT